MLLLCGLLWLSSCSLQQQIDKAETEWLLTKSKSLEPALHRVTLQNEVADGSAFQKATAVSTYLTGKLKTPAITELSGLAAVHGSEGLFWAINDSGNQPNLYIISNAGELIDTVNVPLANRDWEDLASFELYDEPWLVIAETGDNLRRQNKSSLYFFKQPDIENLPASLAPHHQIVFSYEGGPQNVESIAVSASDGLIYLISKEYPGAGIYTLPLQIPATNAATANQIAKRVGALATLHPTHEDTWWEAKFAKRFLLAPTAMDISANDRMAVVANYRHVYLFNRRGTESWADAFSRSPQVIATHRMEQSESVAFSTDADRVVVSSEGVYAPVLSIIPGS